MYPSTTFMYFAHDFLSKDIKIAFTEKSQTLRVARLAWHEIFQFLHFSETFPVVLCESSTTSGSRINLKTWTCPITYLVASITRPVKIYAQMFCFVHYNCHCYLVLSLLSPTLHQAVKDAVYSLGLYWRYHYQFYSLKRHSGNVQKYCFKTSLHVHLLQSLTHQPSPGCSALGADPCLIVHMALVQNKIPKISPFILSTKNAQHIILSASSKITTAIYNDRHFLSHQAIFRLWPVTRQKVFICKILKPLFPFLALSSTLVVRQHLRLLHLSARYFPSNFRHLWLDLSPR